MKCLQAVAVSEYMYQKIAGLHEGIVGKVLSLHSGLFNIVLSDEELLTVHTPAHLRTPMSVEVQELPKNCVLQNMNVYFSVSPHRMRCGECMIVLDCSDTFSSRAYVCAERKREPEMLLRNHLRASGMKRPVFKYLYPELSDEGIEAATEAVEKKYGEFLQCRVKQLTGEIQNGNIDQATMAVKQLIGFGPGMTPAGDDFLQGFFLFAQASVKHVETVKSVMKRIQECSEFETTLVSRALWRHFLAGRMSDAAVGLVEAYNHEKWDLFATQLDKLGQIGHSSGDDFLSGVWVAIVELFECKPGAAIGGGQKC